MRAGSAVGVALAGAAWLTFATCLGPGAGPTSDPLEDEPALPIALEVLVDPAVEAPPSGGTTDVSLALRLTNRASTAVRFPLLDTVSIMVRDPAGRLHRLEGGRDGTRAAPELSPPVAPGESLVIERPARLRSTATDGLRLEVEDEFGSLWHLSGLRPGRYRVGFEYRSRRPSNRAVPIWTGTATSPEKEVQIR